MSFRIKTNAMSAHALRELGKQTSELFSSTGKLASGSRINSAGDDAAGLSISENLRAKVRGLSVARRNSLDALSVLEVAESGFFETTKILTRLRELALQASSDTVGPSERNFLDREFVHMKDEIDRIAAGVMYNGVRLVIGMPDPPKTSITQLPNRDIDYPMEFQIDASYLVESDAVSKANPVNVIRFDTKDLVSFTSGENSLKIGEGYDGTRINSKVQAHLSLDALDRAITRVNEQRSTIGATQSRLKDVMTTIDIRLENTTEAKSRISDTDFAAETAKYTYTAIQQNATSSVLAAANVAPAMALSLLRRDEPVYDILGPTGY